MCRMWYSCSSPMLETDAPVLILRDCPHKRFSLMSTRGHSQLSPSLSWVVFMVLCVIVMLEGETLSQSEVMSSAQQVFKLFLHLTSISCSSSLVFCPPDIMLKTEDRQFSLGFIGPQRLVPSFKWKPSIELLCHEAQTIDDLQVWHSIPSPHRISEAQSVRPPGYWSPLQDLSSSVAQCCQLTSSWKSPSCAKLLQMENCEGCFALRNVQLRKNVLVVSRAVPSNNPVWALPASPFTAQLFSSSSLKCMVGFRNMATAWVWTLDNDFVNNRIIHFWFSLLWNESHILIQPSSLSSTGRGIWWLYRNKRLI